MIMDLLIHFPIGAIKRNINNWVKNKDTILDKFLGTDKWRDKIKEVVHVDNTARPHIVDEQSNPKFYSLLKSFHKKTNLPVLINTSLNRRGEPMICSPEDAIRMFYGSGLEYLALGNYLIRK